MKILPTSFPEVFIIEPQVFEDSRGFFLETYHQRRYAEKGITCNFVQDNLSCSVRNTIRGLHYQIEYPQAKLIQVIKGIVFDVVVDLRQGSPHFGRWAGVNLSEENKRQLFVPEGFAHGFCVVSETADVVYKCSDFYAPADEAGILWSDPDVAIEWPVEEPLLSEKDSRLPCLADVPHHRLLLYKGKT